MFKKSENGRRTPLFPQYAARLAFNCCHDRRADGQRLYSFGRRPIENGPRNFSDWQNFA